MAGHPVYTQLSRGLSFGTEESKPKKKKKQTIGLFGDPRPSEQDKHSSDCIRQSLHTETSGDLPDLAAFTKDPPGNGNILESMSKLRGSLSESFLNLLP